MSLEDYYWDGREFKKKDRTLSDLLLGLNYLHQITPPVNPPQNLLSSLLAQRIFSKSPINMWEKFNLFLSRLELSPLQRNNALTKAANVDRVLRNTYYPLLGMSNHAHIIVGSYLKGTAIAPPSDIDILFILPYHNFKRINSYAENCQSALLQEIKTKLLNSFPKTEIKADGQAVLVPFSSYNIEVVPCFRSTNNLYVIPDSNDGGKWKFTCPSEEKRSLQASNFRCLGNTIKLIKMIKAWKNYCSVDIKSLVIELRSIYFLEKWAHYNKGSVYYDWMIRDFFGELLKYVNGSCIIPGLQEKIEYGDAWKSKAETAMSCAQKACEYESMKKPELVSQEWKKIFGDRFPS